MDRETDVSVLGFFIRTGRERKQVCFQWQRGFGSVGGTAWEGVGSENKENIFDIIRTKLGHWSLYQRYSLCSHQSPHTSSASEN